MLRLSEARISLAPPSCKQPVRLNQDHKLILDATGDCVIIQLIKWRHLKFTCIIITIIVLDNRLILLQRWTPRHDKNILELPLVF